MDNINATIFNLPSPITMLDFFEAKKITVLIKREDLIHGQISGNKYRKLKYNLLKTKDLYIKKIVTKGGAFSNHIHATAAVGNFLKIDTVGIIRGEEVDNKTLDFAKKNGMEIFFCNRTAYRNINEENFQDSLPEKIEAAFFIPEGGTNKLAIKGVAEMVEEIENQLQPMPDFICTACGTGGTMTGIIEGLAGRQKALGFSVLKGDFMENEIRQNQLQYTDNQYNNWEIINNYHFGGYAKTSPILFDFIRNFELKYNILLDPIYTSKMMFGIFDLIEKDYFPEGSTVLAIHTGGLQGWNGFEDKNK
jgi:1-aminocyclopropane-1-carboxylate deaminase